MIALVADGYVSFGPKEIFVPLSSSWRPRAVTWGVLAMYGLLVIQVTSWGMKYLPRTVWHGIHFRATRCSPPRPCTARSPAPTATTPSSRRSRRPGSRSW